MTRRLPLLLPLLLLPAAAEAEVPLAAQWPGCGASEDHAACPPDDLPWTYEGITPAATLATIRPEEAPLGIGNAVLPAWQITTGRWDSIVAVADSGVDWSDGRILRKIFLNAGELPLPQNADGTPAASHDRDGNGLVNLSDYEDDPRIPRDAGPDRSDDRLDPGDLIAVFSDGVDGDGNGYTDDIAGWDFHEGDNDPYVRTRDGYGDHSYGVFRTVGAEGGDGGPIGVCPNCAILPIRVGDSFVTSGSKVGEAFVFAGTHRATAVAAAIGALGQPALVEQAMAWASEQGTLVVAAAGDETSYHRNLPAADRHALFVHSIDKDRPAVETSRSFMQFVNCNNFGPRMDLVAATDGVCATGAVAMIAGAAGLVQAAAMEHLGERLHPARLHALLTGTADDVDVAESRDPATAEDYYPSAPGWDPFFGAGRIDVERAVRAVVEGAAPPRASIESPDWFDYVDRTRVSELAVTGRIDAPSWSYRLEWAPGGEPEDGAFRLLGEGRGEGAFDGELGRLEVGREELEPEPMEASGCEEPAFVPPTPGPDPLAPQGYDASYRAPPLGYNDGVVGRYDKLDPYGLTLRLRVEDAGGRVTTVRRYLHVREDPDLLPGFPVASASSFESSPALADLDGDQRWEIVIADSGGWVHVLTGEGEPLPGWPQPVAPLTALDPAGEARHDRAEAYRSGAVSADHRQVVVASVAVGALDGSGPPDVVAATLDGLLHAWRADGTPRPGFPVTVDFDRCAPETRHEDRRVDCGFFGTPTLVDLTGDGRLEVLAPGMDQHLYLWDADGDPVPGWPVLVDDPDFEAVAGRHGRITSSPSVGDLDGDGSLDIVIGTSQTAGGEIGGFGVLYALDAAGALKPGWPITVFAGFAGALPFIGEGIAVKPALGDVDGDGDDEVVANALADPGAAYDGDGSIALDFAPTGPDFGSRSNSGEPSALFMLSNPILADADGDGFLDVFSGGAGIGYGANIAAWTRRFEHDHLLLGYSGAADEEGVSLPLSGFPRQMEDMQFIVAPAAADLDGDGRPDIVQGSTTVTRAFRHDGREPAGSPWFHGGWQVASSAVGDVDGDGYLDLVAATREGLLFAWRTQGRADRSPDWPMFGHDPRRTGNVATPIAPQPGPPEEDAGSDCSFASGSSRGAPALLLLPFVLRRRRR